MGLFLSNGSALDTDLAGGERNAGAEAPHSDGVPADSGPSGAGTTGAGTTGAGTTGAGRMAASAEALDALLSAAAKAIRVLDAEARPDASAPLREAVDAITGGRGTWRATVQIGAAVSHCVVTGTWLDARQEAAALLGVSANNVTMRRVK